MGGGLSKNLVKPWAEQKQDPFSIFDSQKYLPSFQNSFHSRKSLLFTISWAPCKQDYSCMQLLHNAWQHFSLNITRAPVMSRGYGSRLGK